MNDDPTIQHGAQPPADLLPFEPRRIGGVIAWPGNDLTAQRRIALPLREQEFAAVGHAEDCWCPQACARHRERINQLRGQLGLPKRVWPPRPAS